MAWNLFRRGGVALAEPRRPEIDELGSTGSDVVASPSTVGATGYLTEQDYSTDLQGANLYTNYDRMRKSDGTIRAGMMAIKLPLLRADWTVEAAADDTKSREIAEFCEADLRGMTVSFAEWFWHVLLSLDYGSLPFEIVWEMRDDDRVHVRKLAPRHPRTITKWLVDERGGFAGVEQQTMRTDGFHSTEIPARKMVVYVNQKEFSNFRGVSLLRACYKHWRISERMQITDAIAKEKRSLGVDVGTLSGESGNMTTRRAAMERALMTLHSHEKQFFTEIDGQTKYRLEGIGRGGTLDPLETVEYHDLRALRALLAEFIAMGAGSTGSLAMHKDKSSFFLMALAAVGEMVGDTTDSHLIRKMVDYNFGPQAEYPHFRHSRLDTRAVKELADSVKVFVESGVLIPGPDDEDEVRAVMDFPDKPDEEDARTPPAPAEPTGEPPPSSIAARRRLARPRRRRELTVAERRVDFAKLEAGLDEAQQRIVEYTRRHQARQVDNLVAQGRSLFRSRDARKLEDVNVMLKGEVARDVLAELKRLFELGRREVERELEVQGVKLAGRVPTNPFDEEQAAQFLGVQARAFANLMGDRLRATFTWEMLQQFRVGTFDEASLTASLTRLSEREVKRTAGSTVSTALNLGRQAAAVLRANEVEHAIFSSVLDAGTCLQCESLDGVELLLTDPRFDEYRPPYTECDGRGRCRCTYVYVTKAEQRAAVR